MDITLTWTGDGIAFDAQNQAGATVAMGTSEDRTSPMVLLLEAVAGCFSVDAVSILQKQQIGLRAYTVTAHGERGEDGHAKPYRAIHLDVAAVADKTLSEEQARRVAQLGIDYCSVAKSLKADVTATVTVKTA